MAVRIRLARYGRTHRPFYRVVAIDSREHREGHASEVLGTYDPLLADKNISVDIERVYHWIQNGAKLNPSVAGLLKRFGYEPKPEGTDEREEAAKAKAKEKFAKRSKKDSSKPGKRTKKDKDGNVTYVTASRRALKKHQAKLKAVRMAELAKEAEARAAAAAEAEAASSEETAAEA